LAVAARAGPERVGAREKALPKELGCGMRMEEVEDAHRHERKVDACEWRAHTDTKEKISGIYTGEARVGYGCK
jgi:hypothetical protein